jgi:uncharacterized protein
VATTLFTLLDDVASVLDDVAILTKVAGQKTAGVLGDDLALNAEQVAGVVAERELPVVWAVAKGSAKNKLIIVPTALLISWAAPWAVIPILMIGGAYLCFEGVEKVVHKFLHSKVEEAEHHREEMKALANPAVDIVAWEKEKIRGAIRTDVILSAEIIVIALDTVKDATFMTRVIVLVSIAAVMTVGVYGFVALIVKLDDIGVVLDKRKNAASRALGKVLLRAAPYLMKFLSFAGTLAMFLVGGGILVHGIPPLHDFTEPYEKAGGFLGFLVPNLTNMVTGALAGAIALAIVTIVQKIRKKRAGR